MAIPLENVVQEIQNSTLNMSDFKDVFNIFPPSILNGLDMLMTLAKVATIIFIIYLVFLIVQSIVRMRQAHNMKVIALNVVEINKKLDVLIDSKKKPSKEEKQEKSK